MRGVVNRGFKIHVAAIRLENADRHLQSFAGKGIFDRFEKLAVNRIHSGIQIGRGNPTRKTEVPRNAVSEKDFLEMVFELAGDGHFLFGVANRKFGHDPHMADAFRREFFPDALNVGVLDGVDFAAPMIDGARQTFKVVIRAIKLRIDPRPTRDNHADLR